ncbi:MAG TPA: hypothetical protein VIU40_12130, partial [Geobacteraceae bacterium]
NPNSQLEPDWVFRSSLRCQQSPMAGCGGGFSRDRESLDIQVKSRLGEGAQFTVLLPVWHEQADGRAEA